MTIEFSPEIETKIRTEAQIEGLSVAAYVERLVCAKDSWRSGLASFRQAIDERLQALDSGESVDGDEVMARLIAEVGTSRHVPGSR